MEDRGSGRWCMTSQSCLLEEDMLMVRFKAWHGGHDFICKSCQLGIFQHCDNATVNGVYRDGGCKLF